MNLKKNFFHYPWFALADIKIVYRQKKKNYQFRNNLSNTLSDILWSLLKDTWTKIANERSHMVMKME